ncbi:MAG: chromosome segregation protein SMC [Phycisphaerales bacterium]|nr:chromosome segregation protein SMC [Phycisphaerales bacterium]
MRLAKLTLSGFKSFADRTEFTFDAAVTGIVGPNGCGKSNVVDAVKWVLGERSAKSLRGSEMADVIFSGSAGRKPSGLASVTLTFDNPLLSEAELALREARRKLRDHAAALDSASAAADAATIAHEDASLLDEASDAGAMIDRHAAARRHLPIDADTVEVERRLYRDGTSQYLINQRKARLRDIRELFMDTGVGADAYSIIEQGKVDAMLLANPYERRVFFEEAAGVAKFKARRIEAQRKLERAETNLVRAREQLESTERRLRIVKGQAVKARRFKELDTELRALKAALAFAHYDDLRQRLDGLTSRLQDLESERIRSAQLLAACEQEKQDAELVRHEIISAQQGLERERSAAEHRAASARQRRAMSESALAEERRRLSADESRIGELEAQIVALTRDAEEQAGLAEQTTSLLNHAEQRLNAAATTREALQRDLTDQRLKLGEARGSAANIERERIALVTRVESDRRRLAQLAEQQARAQARLSGIERESADLGSQHEAAFSQAAERRTRVLAIEADLARHSASAADLSAEQRSLTERLNESEQLAARLDSRRAVLQEMAEQRVGLAESVKAVLARRDDERAARASDPSASAPFAEIIAPLAELIEVDRSDAVPVEAALGSALQALVVPRPADAGLSAMVAGAVSLPGRVALLPVESAAETALDIEGATPLSGLVRTDAAFRPLIDRLLGRTFLVESLDGEWAPLLRSRGARIVTRDGALVEPDGRVVLGPMSGGGGESQGLLQRAAELADLETRLADLSTRLDADRNAARDLGERAAAINAAMSERRSALAAEQRALAGDEARVERLASDAKRLERDRTQAADELAAASQRAGALEREQAQADERAQSLQRLADEQNAVVAELEAQIASAQQRLDTATEQLAAARVEAGQLGEKLAGARRELRRLNSAAEEADRAKARVSEHLALARGRLAEHERTIAEAEAEVVSSTTAFERAEAELAPLAARLDAAAGTLSQLADRLSAARAHAGHIERDWNSLEISKRELEVRREHLEDRTREDIAIDLAAEYDDYRATVASGGVAAIDTEAAAAQAEALKDEIRKLGNVNLDAIDEESQLATRNEDLIRQVADIDSAREQLASLIQRLSDASRDRFREAFEKIAEHFSGDSGMFRKLFGGGRAEVRLIPMPDTGEVDWLESGVEVTAKPPGKEPRSISQLSGGEKTMTAVALLLSIFQSKPSPFCILDEVDAALDDSNVGRFAGIIRQFLDQCHFIVITHNKKTMQAADQLYGVTMQERGVSKRVAVRFDQVREDGHIDGAAAGGDPATAPAEASAGQASAIIEPRPRRRKSAPIQAS